jgi:hypothetical protein
MTWTVPTSQMYPQKRWILRSWSWALTIQAGEVSPLVCRRTTAFWGLMTSNFWDPFTSNFWVICYALDTKMSPQFKPFLHGRIYNSHLFFVQRCRSPGSRKKNWRVRLSSPTFRHLRTVKYSSKLQQCHSKWNWSMHSDCQLKMLSWINCSFHFKRGKSNNIAPIWKKLSTLHRVV